MDFYCQTGFLLPKQRQIVSSNYWRWKKLKIKNDILLWSQYEMDEIIE